MARRNSGAIVTKHLGSTETRDAKIKATLGDFGETVIIPYDRGMSAWKNHLHAARELAAITGRGGAWLGGTLGPGKWAWVRSDQEYSFRLKKRQLDMFGLPKRGR